MRLHCGRTIDTFQCDKKLTCQLVNNEVFPPSLNSDLTNLFLDLKEGAKIISLKPFVPESFKMNESNVSDRRVGQIADKVDA